MKRENFLIFSLVIIVLFCFLLFAPDHGRYSCKQENCGEKNLSVLEMPSGGKILTGYYEGDYEGFKKLYAAMDRYVGDKGLKLIAVPYERYLTDPRSIQDSLHMKIGIYFLVF
jgi:effector-binding domain-containing protein